METRANHVLIGAFTLGVCILAVLFALWAAKYTTEKSFQEYDVVFQEAVTGLSVGSQVLYSGISVGAVRNLSLVRDDPRKVVARIRLSADTPVKTDTRAKLTLTGLTGTAVIQLTGGSPGSPALEAMGDQRVATIPSEPSALQNIAATADEIVGRVNVLLSEENIARIARTLEQLDQVTGAIAGERDEIAALIRSARSASDQLEKTLASADRTIGNLDQGVVKELPAIVARLDRTLADLEKTSQTANAMLSENRGAISDFSNDGLGQVAPTMRQLRALIRELDDLADKVETNPAGFILGREQPKEFEP